MALTPLHADPEEERRLLQGLPASPLGAPRPIAAPPMAPIPAQRPIAPAAPQAPVGGPAAPVQSIAPPPSIEPDAAAYVRSKLAASPQREAYKPSASPWALLAGIAAGMQGKAPDYGVLQAADQAEQAKADRRRAEEDANPASERSARARAAAAPTLKRLYGIEDDVIAGLSAAQIGAMTSGNDLAAQYGRSRAAVQAAEAAKAGEAKAIEKRDEKRKYDETQAAGPKFEREKELARIRSGLGGDRSMDAAYLSDRLQREREAERFDRERAAKAGEKAGDYAKDYGVALSKTGIPGVETQLQRIDELAAKLKQKNGGKLFSEGDDLKRRGADAINKPELYATMSDPDAAELMREVVALRNVQIKDQAGSAVAASEFGRQQAAMGSSALNDSDSILRWTGGMRQGLEADRANLLGAFGPAAVEQYDRNRGGGKAGAPSSGQKPTEATVRIQLPDGTIKKGPASNLDAALKKYPGAKVVQ